MARVQAVFVGAVVQPIEVQRSYDPEEFAGMDEHQIVEIIAEDLASEAPTATFTDASVRQIARMVKAGADTLYEEAMREITGRYEITDGK